MSDANASKVPEYTTIARSDYEWEGSKSAACGCGRCLICEVNSLAGPGPAPTAKPIKAGKR